MDVITVIGKMTNGLVLARRSGNVPAILVVQGDTDKTAVLVTVDVYGNWSARQVDNAADFRVHVDLNGPKWSGELSDAALANHHLIEPEVVAAIQGHPNGGNFGQFSHTVMAGTSLLVSVLLNHKEQ